MAETEILTPDDLGFDPLDQEVTPPGPKVLHEADVWITATLRGIDIIKGQYGPRLRWRFVCDGDEGKGSDGEDYETYHYTTANYTESERNGLREFVKWLTGKVYVRGERPPLRSLIGRRFDLMFEHDTNDGITRDKVFRARPAQDQGQGF